jgi:DGQHR domain-containing protein
VVQRAPDLPQEDHVEDDGERIGVAARLITQGKHRFYTLVLQSDVLAETCMVEPRYDNPMEGFQRRLDAKRAQDIADYVDAGFGTIPTSVVLSAQPDAGLSYSSRTQVLRFNKVPRAFLILDGQHRVYGFQKAKTNIRVPVVVYNGLNRSEEARLFVDINTKQRPVPNELLLDIKRLANDEKAQDALMHDIFDLLNSQADSPLLGLMSPSERTRGKISRVTFNAALGAIQSALGEADAGYVYGVLSPYLHAWLSVLRENDAAGNVTNATLFRAIILLFPLIADRVSQRYDQTFTQDSFEEAMRPMLVKAKSTKQRLQTPGNSSTALYEYFKHALEGSFSLSARGR